MEKGEIIQLMSVALEEILAKRDAHMVQYIRQVVVEEFMKETQTIANHAVMQVIQDTARKLVKVDVKVSLKEPR